MLISECLFDVLNFPKKQRKNWQISAQESNKWSNHKIKAHYNDFDTNYVQIISNIIRRCLYFVDFITFYILGQKFVKFFLCIFGKFKIVKDILKLIDLYHKIQLIWFFLRTKSSVNQGVVGNVLLRRLHFALDIIKTRSKVLRF